MGSTRISPILVALLMAFAGMNRAQGPAQDSLSLFQSRPGTESENSAAAEEAISGLPATFVGTIPCADCPGIRYQVNLLPDHTFASRMTYLERKTEFTDNGSWQIAEGERTLVLLGERGTREQFALLNANTLRELDADGHEFNSKFNYDLKRTPTFIPIESQGKEGSALAQPRMRSIDMIDLDEALRILEKLDSQQGKIVELRLFGGLSIEPTSLASLPRR